MRSLRVFSEISVKPSFLRTTAARKPRTECCRQPVACMIVAIVAPLGCLSRARTASCLVQLRVEPDETVPGFAGLFARLLASGNLDLEGFLAFDILGSFSVVTGQRRHHRSPAVAPSPAG